NSANGMTIVPEIVDAATGGDLPALGWLKYQRYDSSGNSLLRKIRTEGAETAVREYRQSRKGGAAATTVTEDQLNRLGYDLLAASRFKDAIEVFKLDAEDHPKSANAWVSLGEAYKLHGDKELAIKYYQRSVELDPGNTNALVALKKLRAEEKEHTK